MDPKAPIDPALDDLRSALLDSRNARTEEIEVETSKGPRTVLVKQASMALQGRLLKQFYAAAKSEDPELINAANVQIALRSLFWPVSMAPVFNDRDVAEMSAQPCVGWIEKVHATAMRLMRSVPQKTCKAEVLVPAVDGGEPVKKVCGGVLVVGAPRCPWCGAEVPSELEVAKGN